MTRNPWESARRIAALLAEYPVMDGHNDIAWALRKQVNYDLDSRDISVHQPTLHTDIPRLRAGGVGAQFFSVYVPGTLPPAAALIATLEQIDFVAEIVHRYPEHFGAARTAGEVRAVLESGRIAALMGAEGGHSIAGSPAVLRALRRLGVAYLTLTHNHNVVVPNLTLMASNGDLPEQVWADSATDRPAAGGLSEFGRGIVREMNRIGMLVDLSHVAPTTMSDALDESVAPVMFSHSSCRAMTDHVRDVPDDVLVRLAGNGGIVMITFVSAFVSQACADRDAAFEEQRRHLGIEKSTVYTQEPAEPPDPAALAELARWESANPAPVATLSDVADHLDHAREVAGPEHIGLGGDYDGTDSLPDGLADVSTYPALLTELADRHWSDSDLAALTNGNILRVLQAAQDAAEPHNGLSPW